MTIEQLKAAIAALSATEEDKETNASAIAVFEAQLQALVDSGANEGSGPDEDGEDDEDGDLTPEQQALVDKQLKKMKGNMDKMSAKLKAQAAATAQAEADAKAAEIARLKEDGKVQEALELELKAAKEKLSAAEESNTKLTRDSTIETVLSAFEFRNTRSRAHAKRDLTDEMVQVDGVWQHKSGVSIADAVEAYAKDTENKYLFKPKTNSGGGTNNSAANKDIDTNSKPNSLFELTGAEMLKRAAAGKLGKMNY
jgi:hypothetical protein